MIAYDHSGSLIVLADGAELLVHDGPSEGPLWRRSDDRPLVAVGAADGAAIAVDCDGGVRWFDARRDHLQASVEGDGPTRGAAIADDGAVLLIQDDGIRVVTRDGPGLGVELPGTSAAAWHSDGRVLIGTRDSKIAEVDARGEVLRGFRLDEPIVAIARSPRGFWIVATPTQLARLEDGAEVQGNIHHITTMSVDDPLRSVVCSADGALIAFACGDHHVGVIHWPSRDTVASLNYLERKVTGLSFGPGRTLTVGLDLGDGNKYDLRSGGLARTDTHPGREHHSWVVRVSFTPVEEAAAPVVAAPVPRPSEAPIRGAYARPAQPAPRKSGAARTIGIVLGLLVVVYAVARML